MPSSKVTVNADFEKAGSFSDVASGAYCFDAVEWAVRGVELGAGEILLTSMDADGTCAGYDCELTRRVSDAVSVPVIASGGAGTLDHLAEVLDAGHADAVLAASIFHFGTYTIPEAKRFLKERGIPVREPSTF